MSEEEDLQATIQKLRRLKAIREKIAHEAKYGGYQDPRTAEQIVEQQDASAAAQQKAIADIKADPKGFFKTALGATGARINQLMAKTSPDYPKEVIAENDAKLASLQQQPGGTTGLILGDTVATLPFGAIGSLVRGSRALVGGSRLARAVTSAPAAAAAEGAAVGGLLNGKPFEGAALGGTLNLLGRGLGKTLTGPIAKSSEAKAIQELAESQGLKLHLPVGVAAKNPLVRGAFGDVLPSLPGAQKAMAAQKKQLQAEIDDLAARTGAPQQDVEAVLGAGIRSPSEAEKKILWGTLSITGLLPKVLAGSKLASTALVNKSLLGDYALQQNAKKLGVKLKPLTEAIRRNVVVEGTEDE